MKKAIFLTTIFVLVVVLISTVGIVGYKTANYMVRQNFEFGDALRWAIEDYNEEIEKMKGENNTTEYYTWENNINKYVEVVPCVDLNK